MSNVKVEKDNGIYAEVIAHSVSPQGKEIVTVAVKYGLIVHAEFLRHRQLSRGVKSNRAIPTKTIRKEVLNDPYVPVFLGKNKAGMQSVEEIKFKSIGKTIFLGARYPVVFAHWLLEKMGAHKEWTNRLLNPWQWVRETITATEWENLYALRLHEAAQRDIRQVVECVQEAISLSRQHGGMVELEPGEWHTPYVTQYRDISGTLYYIDNDGSHLSVANALQASTSRCARSSYDKHDGTTSLWKDDVSLYNTLVADDPKHMSPCEHQATPMRAATNIESYREFVEETIPVDEITEECFWQRGVTHADRSGKLWSGNFQNWIQHRQLIPNHVKLG